MHTPRPVRLALTLITLLLIVVPVAGAQSLNGSRSSVNRQELQAKLHDFSYMETPSRVNRFVNANLLVKIPGNANYDLHDVSYPFARPAVKVFVERLSSQFRSACGEKLTVTSLTRPLSEQPRNASDQSVHPTGIAVDLRVPSRGNCRTWLNSVLLSLEGAGVLEATQERSPPHYHVAVFPNRYQQYVEQLATEGSPTNYVVQRGDSLSRVARKTGSTIEAIRAANGVKGSLILVGQLLRIPD